MKKKILIILFLISLSSPFYSLAEENNKNTNNIKIITNEFLNKIPFKGKLDNYFLQSEVFRKNQLFSFLIQKDKAQNKIFVFEERINNQTLEENKKEVKNVLIYLKYYYFGLLAFIFNNIFIYYILILIILFYIIYKIWNKFK